MKDTQWWGFDIIIYKWNSTTSGYMSKQWRTQEEIDKGTNCKRTFLSKHDWIWKAKDTELFLYASLFSPSPLWFSAYIFPINYEINTNHEQWEKKSSYE